MIERILHEKGFISDPKSKAKSVTITEEGLKRSEELFNKFFVIEE
jgi:predicted transcriptional regulator